MQAAVFFDEIGRFVIEHAADGVSARLFGNGRVDLGDAGLKAFDEDGVLEGGALRRGAIGGNVAAMKIGPAERFERLDAGMFDVVFGEAERHKASSAILSASRTRTSPDMSLGRR